VGAKEPKSGQGFHTGKDALNATANVFKAKPELAKRPVVLLYDNDVSKEPADFPNLYVRSMPTNTENTVVTEGIENLLPANLLMAQMFDEKTTKKKNGCIVTIKTLNKMKLSKHLCETKRDPNDFTAFGQVLDMIEAIAKLQELDNQTSNK
jgi:hypothetical protein